MGRDKIKGKDWATGRIVGFTHQTAGMYYGEHNCKN